MAWAGVSGLRRLEHGMYHSKCGTVEVMLMTTLTMLVKTLGEPDYAPETNLRSLHELTQ